MKITIDRRLYVLLVIAFAFMTATAGMGTAAVTGTDSETTDTNFESEVQANDVRNVTDNGSVGHQFTVVASNESDSAEYPALDLLNNETGDTHIENNSATNVSGPFAAGSYFNLSVTNGDLKIIEHDRGENVTVTAQFTNNSSTDTVDHEITFYLDFKDDRSVEYVNSTEADEDDSDVVTYESEEQFLGGEDNETTVEFDEERNVSGDSAQTVIVLGNETVLDDFDSVASDRDSGAKLSNAGFFSNTEKNVVLLTAEDGTTYYVPVFKSEAPDEWQDANATYAVYDESYAGETAFVINKGEALEDVDTLETVKVVGAANNGAFINFGGIASESVRPADAPDSGGFLGLGVMTGATADGATAFAATIGLIMARPEDLQDGRAPAFQQFDADSEDDEESDEQDGPTASATTDGGAEAAA